MKFLTTSQTKLIEEIKDYLATMRAVPYEEIEMLLSIISKQQKCIDLMLYYVNSDSTWEALQDRCRKIMGES